MTGQVRSYRCAVTSSGSAPGFFGRLAGEWAGKGEGFWGGNFVFTDQVSFTSRGKPWLEYRQLTLTASGEVSHSESGYLWAEEDSSVTMSVAEPSGITEVLTGVLGEDGVELHSTGIGRSARSRPVTATRRRISIVDEKLVLEVAVAMNGEPLSPHTRSVLERT